jgi:hypothetical protein
MYFMLLGTKRGSAVAEDVWSSNWARTEQIIYIILYYVIFIANCNWAFVRWQCYINNEQYVNSNT